MFFGSFMQALSALIRILTSESFLSFGLDKSDFMLKLYL